MPSRNVIKQYVPYSYYHVYNRGINKQAIFLDNRDYRMFLHILKRHFSAEESQDSSGRLYESFYDVVDLLTFCLMPNHFHLLLYQKENEKSLEKVMQKIGLAYTIYFNKRYNRVGPMFQGRYKASRIGSEEYLLHISRYIHLNPSDYVHWEWSSLPYYTGKLHADWVKPNAMIGLFEGKNSYMSFLADHEGYKKVHEKMKQKLANC